MRSMAATPKKSSPNRNGLTLLGNSGITNPDHPSKAVLETFENLSQNQDYLVSLDCPDFTSLCPVTNQPDFAHITITYVPSKRCVETKSIKLYLASFRNLQAFNEEVVNRIFGDLLTAVAPKELKVEGRFAARGGISLSVVVEHPKRKTRL
jgi:7-cyano-7-deazaguanine reductase